MDIAKLLELKSAVEAKFDALTKEAQTIEADLREKNTELTKLMGDFRTYESLIENWVDKSEPNEGEVVNG